ncbi:capsular biosynthesis protein [Endozoicomonas sp. OPT23]|uniref:capsular biosynthesis protein n=1 Tax=Endozoicomonas sp. OPT23 TaxID=2072845 RepID=UPI001E644A54|nr:capsular biosynthesis protein [Endozoicomonas sp. OPT23]
MAGLSSRFTKAGYDKPKYMLKAKNKTLFQHSVESFKKYFDSEQFLFIALEIQNTEQFIEKECRKFGLKNYQTVILPKPTKGQAETVYMGLKEAMVAGSEHLIIFNIDTFRPGFTLPTSFSIRGVDGYLETFIGSGANWSNVVPISDNSDRVKLTAEKEEVSELCCTGLYVWSKSELFYQTFQELSLQRPEQLNGGEYYIAPMYNTIIKSGGDIRYTVIDKSEVVFCGVPEEYMEFIAAS